VDRGRRLDVAFEEEASRLGDRDRGWVQEVAYGTVRLRGRLDHLLDLQVTRGLASVPDPLRPVLRLGAYQLLYTGSAPAYAAVSETVDLARTVGGRRGAGLVNAVLRGLDREGAGPDRFPSFDADPAGWLSTWGSHPRWLVDRWLARYGPGTAREIVEANNRIPSLFLKPVTVSLEEAGNALEARGIRPEPGPPGSGTLLLPRGTSPAEVLALVPGAIIQDPAAALVAEYVGVGPGQRIADLCAAPGGKGMVLAGKGARVVAGDLSPVRIRRVAENARRLGLPVHPVVARAEAPPLREADVVLLDVPCTGTGTLGRHPDARWRLASDDPERLARTQDRILDGAAPLVRAGGLLVYATCTLEPEENEERAERFLEAHPDFELEPKEDLAGPGERAPYLRLLPGREGTDGAFAARFRRRA
jgi:16S rRNA (cytosine967-C5)-methyltransferase